MQPSLKHFSRFYGCGSYKWRLSYSMWSLSFVKDCRFACCNCTTVLALLSYLCSSFDQRDLWQICLSICFTCTVSSCVSSFLFLLHSLSFHLPLCVVTHTVVSLSLFFPPVLWVTDLFLSLQHSHYPIIRARIDCISNWVGSSIHWSSSRQTHLNGHSKKRQCAEPTILLMSWIVCHLHLHFLQESAIC